MVSEGLEITQPALDPDLSTDIHHRITIRNKMSKVHRCFYLSDFRTKFHAPPPKKNHFYAFSMNFTLFFLLKEVNFTFYVGEYTTIDLV
jgi:hypothetical protein